MKWWKEWHGVSADRRWQGIALTAKVKVVEVVGIVIALKDFASQQPDRGSVAEFPIVDVAACYGMRPERVQTILQAMRDRDLITNDRWADWHREQDLPTPDNSAERTRRYRERQRATARAINEENESDVPPGIRAERDDAVTAGDHAVTAEPSHRDGEIERKDTGSLRSPVTRARDRDEFARWWQHYPHKVGKGQAERAFSTARKLASLDDLIAGIERYIAAKPPDRQWLNPATWLNGKRWLDEPAPSPSALSIGGGGIGAGDSVSARRAADRFRRLAAEQAEARRQDAETMPRAA